MDTAAWFFFCKITIKPYFKGYITTTDDLIIIQKTAFESKRFNFRFTKMQKSLVIKLKLLLLATSLFGFCWI